MRDSVLTDTVVAAVAQHVRALRRARGWSLDELAGRSGVSKGMVVQIEGARTNPSVGILARLAEAFGVSVARLLEQGTDRTVRVTSADDAPLLWRGGYGGFGRLLAGASDPDVVELWEWGFAAGDQYTSADHAPGTREMLHVLAGSVTITVDGVEHAVETGQTIDFQADRAHGYRNDGPGPARVLMVVVTATA